MIIKFLLVVFLLPAFSICRAQHTIEKVWETTGLARPECVLAAGDILYVSLEHGEPLVTDGIGLIVRLRRDGSIIDSNWIAGLNAPKGMGLWNGKLYVTDITKVVVINTETGKIETVISVAGAKGLNDIEFDRNGVMYVSDPEADCVYRFRNGKPERYVSQVKSANGLKAVRDNLYILTDTALLAFSADKKPVTVIPMEPGGDGIQPVGNGDFLLTLYQGAMYYLSGAGHLQTLLDTRAEKKSTADFDFDPVARMIYVPTLTTNSVVAYRLH